MANYREDIVSIELTGGNIHRAFMQKTIGGGDDRANRFGVRVYRNGEPEQMTGSCFGLFIRADGATVAIENGTISGNLAYVTLPEACYAVEGVFTLAIKITYGGEKVTMRIVDGVVSRTSTDVAVDPGTIIPSVEALIEEIENVKETIPQDYTELSTGFDAKYLINDLIATSLIPAVFQLDDTGIVTTGKAWRADKGEVTGSQYSYTTYEVPSNYAGNVAIIYGHGWGKPYPVVCFYDSNMDFIMSAGWRGDTDYKGLPVVIPPATATIVINHRSDSTFPTGIAFYTITDAVSTIKKVGTYGGVIDNELLEKFPSYKNVRNLPTNCVYSLGASAYTEMQNLPNELNTYATILKVNGANGAQLSGGNAYNLYLCGNEYAVWVGFETNYALSWRLISGTVEQAKKYLFIGDSYGDGYSHDGNNSGWPVYLAQKLGLTNTQYEKQHQGGSGFANGGFLARLNAASGSGFTDIVVLGGFNDYNATAENIETAISTFCTRARALFPGVKIHIGCVGWIKAGTGESAYSNWQDVRNEITGKVLPTYQNCKKAGADYIAFSEYLLTDALMTPTDGYHPGEDGNKAIAAGIANAINGGVACMPFKSVLKQ